MSTIGDEDEDDGLEPPSARRVAERALVLSAVIARAFIDQDAGRANAERLRERMRAWLGEAGVDEELESNERSLLEMPLGRVTPQRIADATWQSEGLAVLAWALQLLDLPAHDELIDPKAAADAVGYLEPDRARALLGAPRLRPANELAELGEIMFALHWRLQEFRLSGSAIDFAAVARGAWFGPLDLTGLRLVDGDLAIGALAISEAPDDEIGTCMSIARERHRAINWLLGHDPLWSETPTNT